MGRTATAAVSRVSSFGSSSLDLADEAVATLRQRLDIARCIGFVAERLAQFLDRRVQAVVEINERVGGPEALANLLAGDQLAGLLQQDFENLDRLALQLQPDAILTELSALRVELEGAETENRVSRRRAWHTPGELTSITPEHSGESVILVTVVIVLAAVTRPLRG